MKATDPGLRLDTFHRLLTVPGLLMALHRGTGASPATQPRPTMGRGAPRDPPLTTALRLAMEFRLVMFRRLRRVPGLVMALRRRTGASPVTLASLIMVLHL